LYGNSQNYDYLHPDWLGNARIDSDLTNHTVTTDQAYTPYGEIYDIFGSNVGQNEIFATMNANFAPATTTPVMWDTPNRELSMVSRWLSPDPAGVGWNQYAYPTNPNSTIDPLGLAGVNVGGPCPQGDIGVAGGCNRNTSTDPTAGGACNASIDEGSPVPCALIWGTSTLSTEFGVNLCSEGCGTHYDWQWKTPVYGASCDNWGCGPIFLKSAGGWQLVASDVFASAKTWGPLTAGLFYPGQNGAFQFARNAANNFMKKPITNPNGMPGPPEPPPDLGGRNWEAIEAFEKMAHGLMLLMENGEIQFMFAVMPDAEVCATLNNCGGDTHQF
jgi:hypothetical protein